MTVAAAPSTGPTEPNEATELTEPTEATEATEPSQSVREPGAAPSPSRSSRAARVRAWLDARPGWQQWLLVVVGLMLLTTPLVARYAYGHPSLSRADEYVYIDSVDKAMHGEITRQGASVDEYAMDLLACEGIELYGPMGDRCGGPYDTSTFPYRGGITSADIHSPVYYFTTAALTKVVQVVTPVDDLLVAARMTGAIWLALGLAALIALARELGAPRTASAAVALLVLAAPSVRWTNAYVTPDALNLLAGSLIAIAAVRYVRGRWSPWILVGLSALAAAVKAQNSIAAALAALFLLVYAITVADGRSWRRTGRFAAVGVGAVVASLVVQMTYNALRAAWAIAPAPPMDTSEPLNLGTTFLQVKSFMHQVVLGPDAGFGPALENVRPGTLPTLTAWLLAAGLIAAAVFAPTLDTIQSRFAQATALAFVTAGPAFYVLIFVMTGRTFGMPDRYGQVMLPAMAAAAALVARRRWVQWFMIGLAAAGYVAALITLRLA